MGIFLLVLLIGIILWFLFRKKSSNNNQPKLHLDNLQKAPRESVEKLYKKKEIRYFNMKGMHYQNLPSNESGDFIGYAKCEYNKHDQYAVAIYNSSNTLLGYVPAGNRRLNESIKEWHNGKVIAWGNLRYEDYINSWFGEVSLPVGLHTSDIDKIDKVLVLRNKGEKILMKSKITSDEYFSLLNDHEKIIENIKSLNGLPGVYYKFSKKIIPSLSKQLESEKDWEDLIKLEKYSDLINQLNEKFANTTFKRIEKAKKSLL